MVKKAIKLFLFIQLFIFFTYFISFEIYINVQIAFLSSFFIIIGSSYAYKKMIDTQAKIDMTSGERDLLDSIEDPHELYDDQEIDDKNIDDLDFKEIVKEERKKIKILNLKDIKKGSSAGFSLFRLIPYIFLILGFIALKNNNLLDIKIYLPSLLLGIVSASFLIREKI